MTVRELLNAIDKKLMVVIYERAANNNFVRKGAYPRDNEESMAALVFQYGKSSVIEYDTRKHCVMVYLDEYPFFPL